MKETASLAARIGVAQTCRAMGVSKASFYRRRKPSNGPHQPIRKHARALDHGERREVLETLASERFVDRSPGEIVATLLVSCF